jgi:hypothetical protein
VGACHDVAVSAPADPAAQFDPTLSPWPIGASPPPPPPYSPTGRGRRPRRWWLIGAVTIWALVLLAGALISERRDRPTVPEQLDAAAAATAVDRATGALLAAVGPQRVFVLGPLEVRRDCQVTPVRPGAETSRELTVHTRVDEAPAVLDAIGAALPAGYGAEVRHRKSGTVHALRADAGDFIAVRGTVLDGVITLRAESGCRPLGGSVAGPAPVSDPGGSPARDVATQVLTALRVSGRGDPVLLSVTCPNGTTAHTAAVAGLPAPADLGTALRPLTTGSTVVEADPARYAFRMGVTSVVVTAADGKVRVTASTSC